ncbi:MAG TPA: GNAT family N-acetyltransferase [Chitinophagaceae bacterium]|nr:GNAT family N-acetyltransferase [Chitinophagaceae bacterium]
MIIRFAQAGDADEMLNIYKPFIENTATSFETVVPSTVEFSQRILTYTQKYPWLVAEINKTIAGYAYASAHRQRDAYQWSVESSVYVHPSFYRQGIAMKLYDMLFMLLAEMNFVNVYAGVALPNEASVTFHENAGFKHIGIYENVGYKLGAWHSVLWMVKHIHTHNTNLRAPANIQHVAHLLPHIC